MKPLQNIGKMHVGSPVGDAAEQVRQGDCGAVHRICRDVFNPCKRTSSLLKNFYLAAENALAGDVILSSPAFLSFDQFRVNQGTEKVSQCAAKALAPTIGCRIKFTHPNRQTVAKKRQMLTDGSEIILRLAPGFFEEKPRGKNNNPTTYLKNERTLTSANTQ